MKVIQINAVYGFSSTGRTTLELHKYMLNLQIESYVFCAKALKQENGVRLIGGKMDHLLHSLGSHLFGLQGYFSRMATATLLRQLKTIEPDIVILRNLHNNYINVPLLLRFLGRNNIATIVVLHDVWPFTGLCCYYTEDKCFKWQNHCHNCPIIHKYNNSWFFDRSSKIFYDKLHLFQEISRLAIVGVSDWVSNEAKKSPIFSKAKSISRIYNWIDHSVFKPKDISSLKCKMGLSEHSFVVLGIAQKWTPRKGFIQYLELAKNCNNITVVLVGLIENNIEFPSNLIIIPPTNSADELADFYSLADVYLNFSNQETFGKVTAEALSCGTPVIVYNSTANPELCGDGCGFVIENRSWTDAVPFIMKIKAEGKKQYSERCVSFAKKNFSKEKNIEQYINLFHRL